LTNEPGLGGNPTTPDSQRAVFLSYASEDADAAQRICATLRAGGIEVWLDQSELRGGDIWDTAIRRQIKACALFIPIISANTRARVEGYFRLEWKLAIDRSHLIAAEKAFLLPVIVDATREVDAVVPDKFREVQWTRLPAGQAPPAFVERVARLLSSDDRFAPTALRQPPGVAPIPDARRAAADRAPTAASAQPSAFWKSRAALLVIVTAVVIVAGYIAVNRYVLAKRFAEIGATPAAAAGAHVQSEISDKSVAVLPFVDMSEKRDQEYFADGLSDELIGMLTTIPDLRVPARTSSFYFKGKQTTIAEIAKALGVAHVLEGSVRKSGNTLRITAQLIRVDNGYHVWSETYDRKLDDIFKVQDEISGAVVKALKISLLKEAVPKATPAANTEAYTLFLQGRAFAQRHTRADNAKAGDYLRQSLTADPKFAPAWTLLAELRADDWSIFGTIGYKQARAEVSDAATHAVELAPSSLDARMAMSHVLFDLDWHWDEAEREVNSVLALDPGNAEALEQATFLALVRGHCEQAQQFAHSAVERDPLDVDHYRGLGIADFCNGRLAEAEAAFRKGLELNAASEGMHYKLGLVQLMRGDSRAALAEMKQEPHEGWRQCGMWLVLDALGRNSEADQALSSIVKDYHSWEYQIAGNYAHRKDLDQAFAWLERAYQEHDGGLAISVKWDPLLSNLHGDPRYQALLRKMQLEN